MNALAVWTVSLLALSVLGLVAWAWAALAQVERDWQTFSGFEGMHFDIGPQAAGLADASRRPLSG
jgi:hypothetical protein